MDLPSEAAIAGEIGKFLLNGALYRGLRPVMWSPVEKTALAEAEIEYHDHTSTTIWVRFPVIQRAGRRNCAGASVVIWTTTPWTMPGNRAIAAGAEIDYALVRVDGVGRRLAGAAPARSCWSRWRCCRRSARTPASPRITCCTCSRARELAGIVCAHPLRGRGYDLDVPLLLGDFVTTEAGTGFVHIAPGHGEDDFDPRPRARPGGAGDRRRRRHVQRLGAAVRRRARLQGGRPGLRRADEAGALLARGKLVHSYPHSWRSKAPLIFRATPQWFIRMDGPEHIREKALAAIDATAVRAGPGPQPHRLAWSPRRPDWCISRQRAWGVPIAVFVDKRTGEPLRDPAVVAAHRRRRSPPRAPMPGTPRRRRASSATTATRTTTSR